MAVEGRQKLDQEDELLRKAAEERLGEDSLVVMIRRSDEQLQKEADLTGLTEERAQR